MKLDPKQMFVRFFTGQVNITTEALWKWNLGLAGLHFVQGLAVLLLSKARDFPVTTTFLTTDSLQTKVAGHVVLAPAVHQLFSVNLALVIALFFFLSALAHLAMATVYCRQYEADLKRGVNRLRWVEYALSASTMMVAIGFISGVYDLSTLLMLFALTAVMNLMGLAMETHNSILRESKPNWLSYIVGAIAGIVPWVVVALYLLGANVYGSGHVPTFVYWIYGSIFVFFASFAVNMYLQYKKYGKWANYLYGERWYMILSLVAKSLLAWQVFAGALRP